MVGGTLEHRQELGIVERPAGDARADLDASCAEFADGAIHLFERRGDVVHRQRGDEGGKFLRPFPAHLRHAVVGNARELGREIRSAEELGGRQAEGQHLAHILELLAQHRHARFNVPEHAQVRHALDDAGVLRVLLQHLEIPHRHHVVEDVDLHPKSFLLARRAPFTIASNLVHITVGCTSGL